MKNWIYTLFLALGVVACFDDDSSLGTHPVGEIEIGKMKDTSMVSHVGNVLRILPEVKAGYSEEEMSYAWYLDNGKNDNGYRANKIADTKELALEVDLPSGEYTIILEAKAINSYTQTSTFKLRAFSGYAQGFYILKETAGGGTEVDLFAQNQLMPDIMTSELGAPLQGKPITMSVVYGNGYIDDETLEMSEANMLHVFTEQDYRAFRTEDMKPIFSRENMRFDPIPAEEKLYTIVQAFGLSGLSSVGFYSGDAGASSGKWAPAKTEDGGSKQVQVLQMEQGGVLYWNNSTHSLYSYDRNMDYAEEMAYELPEGYDASSLECIASGLNYIGSDEAWFLCEDNQGKRLLIDVKCEMISWGWFENEVEARAVPADKHLATGNIIAGNGRDAQVLYVVDNGSVYLYNLATESETPITLQGCTGEITYVSNGYLQYQVFSNGALISAQDCYNYLIVATRNGAGYNLYFYDGLIGGVPKGKAKHVVTGDSGTVKAVRYCSSMLKTDDMMNALFSYQGPLYPYGD